MYDYFIAYSATLNGKLRLGHIALTRGAPIRGMADVDGIAADLANRLGVTVSIVNWRRFDE